MCWPRMRLLMSEVRLCTSCLRMVSRLMEGLCTGSSTTAVAATGRGAAVGRGTAAGAAFCTSTTGGTLSSGWLPARPRGSGNS